MVCTNNLIIFIYIIITLVLPSVSSSPKYTENEKQALRKFRPMVADSLYVDYMKEDGFLIRWLRSRNLNVEQASNMLKRAIKWRLDNKVDSILEEEIIAFNIPPYYNDGFDNKGNPVSALMVSRIDVRKFVVSGRREDLIKWWIQFSEYGELGVRCLAQNNSDVTKGTVILDLNGYNLRQHACLGCIGMYTELVNIFENYYPDELDNLVMINTPRIFRPLLQILTPLLSSTSLKVLRTFGTDKKEWSSFFLSFIPSNQIRPMFGGTMPEY